MSELKNMTPPENQHQEAAKLDRGLQTILEITRKMAGSLAPDDILQDICIACKDLLNANDTTIMGLMEDGQVLIPLYSDDAENMESLMNFRLPVGSGLTGNVVATGQACIVNDPADSPLLVHVPGTDEDDELEALMSAPLMAADKVLGAITTTRDICQPFTDAELEMLSILAGQAAALFSSARLVSELANSELKFRSLVENAEVGLFRLDMEGRLLSINPYIGRLLHLKEELPEPRRIWGSEAAYRAFLDLFDQGDNSGDFACRTMCEDGEMRDLLILGRKFKDLGYIEGILRDVTAQKHLEFENQSRLRFLENLLNTLPQALVIRNPEGRIVGSNPAFDSIFKSSELMPEGAYERFDRLMLEQEDMTAQLKECLRGRSGRIDEYEVKSEYLAGIEQDTYFSVTSVPITNPEGLMTEMVMLLEDVSERRALRNQLIQSQKMDSVGSLAGGIAHDFNNILSGILGNAGYLRGRLGNDQESVEHLQIIERAVSRASQLTRQLLGFARQGPDVLEPVNLNSVVDQTLDLFHRGIRSNIQLQKEQAPILPEIRADGRQLEQAVLNLLLNAVDAIEGDGRITLRTRRRQVDDIEAEQSSIKPGDYVELEVQDTGQGIDEQVLARIYDPFFSTKTEGKGSGLGLTMVYNIVKSHEGQLDVASRKNFGTRFRMLFPVFEEQRQQQLPQAGDSTGSLIWVIDDDLVLRGMLRRILESQDYAVQVFESGEAVLQAIRESEEMPDLLILDMLMPGMSGLETREELLKRAPDSRILFCSGYSRSQKSELLSLPGVRGFVEKPFTLAGLITLVKQALES